MKNKALFKQVLFYLALLLLPLLALMSFIQISVLEDVRQSYIYRLEKQALQNANEADRMFMGLDMIMSEIVSNEDFQFASNLENVGASLTVLEDLRRYVISNVTIKYVFFTYEDDQFIYSSDGTTFRKDKITDMYPAFYGLWENIFDEAEGMSNYKYCFDNYGPQYTSAEYLICHSAARINGKRCIMVFFVAKTNSDTDGNFFVFDKQGQLLYHTAAEQAILDMQNPAEEEADAYMKISVEQNDRRYVQFFGIQDAMGNFQRILTIYYAIIGVVLVLGIALIAYSIKKYWVPILKQRQETSDTHNLGCLYKIVKGKYTTEEFAAQSEAGNWRYLQGDQYFIVLFQLPKDLELGNGEKVENCLRKHLRGYLLELPEEYKYAYIGSIEKQETASYKEITYVMWKNLEKFLDAQVSFSVSPLVDRVEDIQEIFIRGMLSLDFKFAHGSSCYIDAQQLMGNEFTEVVYPREQIEKMILNIKAANVSEVNKDIDEIVLEMKKMNYPIPLIKVICYELVIAITELMNSTGILSEEVRPSYVNIIMSSETMDELMEKIRNIANNLCQSILERRQKDYENSLTRYEMFIKENALKESFSVQLMADHFGMSPSNLSNVYKQWTGMTIMEHVTYIRMEQAKKWLKDESVKMTLNEIVEQIGYNNTSSFIRKFKRMYGVTPRQYANTDD